MTSYQASSLLRVMTCGSVDDGKSTLLGRMLYESAQVYDDQIEAIRGQSTAVVFEREGMDFSHLLDGLTAEREQGITIDVAYRYGKFGNRAFIFADTPGHLQYTRNMVSAASTADVAIVLVDGRKGLLDQTCRHTLLLGLMGVKHVVLAVNKMDLIDYDQVIFDSIVNHYKKFVARTDIQTVVAIPVSGLLGINITSVSPLMPWYTGWSLLHQLQITPINQIAAVNQPARFAVQWVNRPHQDFRGYAGNLDSGVINLGDTLKVLPDQRLVRIKKILNGDVEQSQGVAGQALTLCTMDDEDISRGNVLVSPTHDAYVADQFQATIIWLSEAPMFAGRKYQIKLGFQAMAATVTRIKYALDPGTFGQYPAEKLDLNDIATCNISTVSSLVFDCFKAIPEMGRFVLIDPLSADTVAAGLIDFPLKRASNIRPHTFTIDQQARAEINKQTPLCLWLTGLSGSGKSTIASALEQQLYAAGHRTYVLDGDNIRRRLNKDLGFTEADRVENVRRVAEVASLMVDAGLIVIVTLISPYARDREMARQLFVNDAFIEIFIDSPVRVCIERDTKGLYAKALRGEIDNFTGVNAPYEIPAAPDLTINTEEQSVDMCVDKIIKWIKTR